MIPIGSHPIWHPFFETLAYAMDTRYSARITPAMGYIDKPQRWTVIAAAAVGAVSGSRVLGLVEQWPSLWTVWRSKRLVTVIFQPGGKTVVGDLLDGWFAVEVAKRIRGIRSRTGDLSTVP